MTRTANRACTLWSPKRSAAARCPSTSMGRTTFSKSGWLAPGPNVAEALLEGTDPIPRFADLCLASKHLQQRMRADLRDRTHTLIWSWAPQLADLDEETCLVHGDFGKRNDGS